MNQPLELNSDFYTKNSQENWPCAPEKLLEGLDGLGISYQVYSHAPIFTVAEGEDLKKQIPGLHCRNLFVKDKKDAMFLVVLGNETAVDLKKLPETLACGRLSFGSPERLWDNLGIKPGSVCPFCIINDREKRVALILDAAMMRAETVCYHPLDNARTIALSPADLLKFFGAIGRDYKILDLPV